MSILNELGLFTKKQVANSLATVGLYNQNLFRWINDNQPIFWNDNPLNYVQNGYQQNGDVYACIDRILTKLSFCPLQLYTVKADKIQQAQKYMKLRSHDLAKAELFRIQTKSMNETYITNLNKLVEQPNPYQTTTEWLKQLAGFYLLTGNSYNYYVGLPASKKWTQMFVLPSPYIHIISGGDLKPVKGYNIYNSRNYTREIPDFPGDSVSHFKTFNPEFSTYGSQLYGQSPLRAQIMTMVRNKDSRIEQNKQVKNGGVYGMLSPDASAGAPNITDPRVKADIKQQIAEAKNGYDLVKRIFVSGAPAKWTQFGLPSTDLQLMESLKFDRTDIANAYQMPITLLNDMSGSTDNNVSAHMKQFIYNCIMTLGNTITDKLTRDTCAPYESTGERLMWMFDYSVLPEMTEDLGTIATALASMFWVTVNERREFQGFGKLDQPEADQILVPKTLQLLSDISLSDSNFSIGATMGA